MGIEEYARERRRIACVIPPFFRLIESKNNRVMPAMAYIAEILHRRGHDVILVNGDYAAESVDYANRISITLNNWLFNERYKKGHESFAEVVRILKEYDPEFVFLGAGDVLIPTVETGNAQSCSFLAEKIKKEIGPKTICIGYGHFLRYAKKEHLKNLDVIISGEGEAFAIDIVEENLRGDLPISWCNSMDDLPILTGDYNYHNLQPGDWDYIMSMRGCPNRCTFCYQPVLRSFNVAFMSPKRFIREIRYRTDRMGTRGFYFSDMIFAPGISPRTLEMLDRLILLKKDVPDFHWWAEARVDSLADYETVAKMKASGCSHLKFGVEMANQEMLNTIKKMIDLREVERAFKLTKELQIKRTAYVLLGCIGFADEDYKAMWTFFKNLDADNYVININVPYIGTELYQQVKHSLHQSGIYKEGEEGFTHTSLVMKEYWGISSDTLKMYFELEGEKDDSSHRSYKKKIVDKAHYLKTGKIIYI